MSQPNYKPTIFACFIGYVVQALTINFSPLLYITFQNNYGMSIPQISSLIAVCFAVQLLTDAFAAKFSSKMNPRATVVVANGLAAVGIAGMGILPEILPPYVGLLVAIILSGTGSGLVEVMVSPIVEACPTKRKAAMMSLLHSFYCWGQAAVVLLSNVFFLTIGIEKWKLLALLWALIPLCNAILFLFVPLAPLDSDVAASQKKTFFKTPVFWVLIAVMACAGASEMAMSQWASGFAEAALGVSKTVGDIMGPFLFAVLMGASRVFYAKFSKKISLSKFMLISSALCILSYLLAAVSPSPILSLIGCAVCGLSVGIMWPGGLSTAAGLLSNGGVALFASLALAGDLGCLAGPTIVGGLTALFGGNFRLSFLFAILFPLLLIVSLLFLNVYKKKKSL